MESLKSEMGSLLKHRQHWRSDEDSQVATVMKDSMKYLEEEVDRTKPFFLWVDSFDPHEPWDPPSVWEHDRDYLYDPGYKGKDQIHPIPGPIEDRFTEKELHHIRMLYAEKVTLVDKWVGKLLNKIRVLGFWDNTLIILTSDHGQPLGNDKHGHGLLRKARPWPYEEMAHVPCLVRAPGAEEGKCVKSFVQTCDVGPTVLDWLGCMRKSEEAREGFKLKSTLSAEDMTGKSILPLVAARKMKSGISPLPATTVFPGALSLTIIVTCIGSRTNAKVTKMPLTKYTIISVWRPEKQQKTFKAKTCGPVRPMAKQKSPIRTSYMIGARIRFSWKTSSKKIRRKPGRF